MSRFFVVFSSLCAVACTTYVVAPSGTSPPAPVTSTTAPVQPAQAAQLDLGPRLRGNRRIAVMPVVFVPRGTRLEDPARIQQQLAAHVELARAHYRELLGTTFDVVPGDAAIYHAQHSDSHYVDVQADTSEDRAHRIAGELLAWRGTDRYTTDLVFLTIYVSSGRPIWAGARTFNGAPGSGGGYAELDVTSLLADQGYRFQSTLVHELGHAFGLTHVTCHGDDLSRSTSIMGANPAHWSTGLARSATPGSLIREERYELAQAQAVFPGLTYDGADLDLDRLQTCFLPPMAETIGPLLDQPGVGFELYYDGQRVNGPDAALYSRAQAKRSCTESARLVPGVRVGCRYNGQPL